MKYRIFEKACEWLVFESILITFALVIAVFRRNAVSGNIHKLYADK